MSAPIVHEDIIKAKMVQLANVTTQAQDRINSQILSNGARDLLEALDTDAYQDYVNKLNTFDEDTYAEFDGLSFDSLDRDQK